VPHEKCKFMCQHALFFAGPFDITKDSDLKRGVVQLVTYQVLEAIQTYSIIKCVGQRVGFIRIMC